MAELQQLDGNLLIGIQKSLNSDWLTPIMKFITMLGEGGYLWIAICILLLIFKKTRRVGIICSLSLVLSFICCNLVIKPIVDRTRPWLVFSEVHAFLPHPGDSSFPSGHSTNFMAPAWALYLSTRSSKKKEADKDIKKKESDKDAKKKLIGSEPELGFKRTMHRWGVVAVILAILVGFSRIYLGMHFPSDVIFGLLLGMICATIISVIVQKVEDKKAQ